MLTYVREKIPWKMINIYLSLLVVPLEVKKLIVGGLHGPEDVEVTDGVDLGSVGGHGVHEHGNIDILSLSVEAGASPAVAQGVKAQ